MVQILGVNFESTMLVRNALQSFYGIGPQICARLMARYSIYPSARISNLTTQRALDLTTEMSGMKIGNDLKREMRENIRRLRDMGAYRGKRHAMGLPVRGQRTRTQTSTATKLNRVERYA